LAILLGGAMRPLLEIGAVKKPALSALGLEKPEELGKYKRAGLNLLWIEVAPGEDQIRRARALLSSASREGLGAVVHLRLDLLDERPNPLDPSYVEACEGFARRVIEALRGSPGIVAWAVGGPKEPALDDRSFRSLLRELYRHNLAGLRTAWRAPIPSFEAVTIKTPLEIDKGKPWGVGRPTLDLAICRMGLIRRLYLLWARVVREADKKRPLVLGPVARARDLPLVPSDFDFVCTNPRPEALLDREGCDPFLVRMAIRAGKFGAFHLLPLKGTGKVKPEDLEAWVESAFLQGASGVLIKGWPALSKHPGLLKALRRVAELVKEAPWATFPPKPSGAVLFEPFSPGIIVKGEGEFGFVEALGEGDPVNLLEGMGRGTPFGPLDFLSLEEVEPERLAKYPVIFCPMTLLLPPEVLLALTAYVEGGGVVCADIGFGGYDSVDGTILYPPQEVLDFLGVGPPADVLDRPGGFIVAERHPLFPSLSPWSSTGLKAFPPPMTIVTMGLGAVAFGLTHPGLTGTYWPDLAGVIIATRGRGFVVYGTMRLWANWGPEDPLFLPFHLDLLRRGADFEVVGGLGARFGRDIVVWPSGKERERIEVRLPFRPELPIGAWTYVLPGQRASRAPLRIVVEPERAGPSLLRFAPVWVEPAQAPAYIALQRCDNEEVSLSISSLSPLTLTFAVEIRSGFYSVPKGSMHEVIVAGPKGEVRGEKVVRAGEGGLFFTVKLRRGAVKVRPLSKG